MLSWPTGGFTVLQTPVTDEAEQDRVLRVWEADTHKANPLYPPWLWLACVPALPRDPWRQPCWHTWILRGLHRLSGSPEVRAGLMQSPATQDHLEEHTAGKPLGFSCRGRCEDPEIPRDRGTLDSRLQPSTSGLPFPSVSLTACSLYTLARWERQPKGPVSPAVESSHLPPCRC